MSTSSTAINSSTSYIGFYGGTEIMIHCPSEETLNKRNNNETITNINKKSSSSSLSTTTPPTLSSSNIRKKRLETNKFNENTYLLGNNEMVIFNFHDSWDGLENGSVDRGLIPDLLFYTCF